jgi:hypothetical protein
LNQDVVSSEMGIVSVNEGTMPQKKKTKAKARAEMRAGGGEVDDAESRRQAYLSVRLHSAPPNPRYFW